MRTITTVALFASSLLLFVLATGCGDDDALPPVDGGGGGDGGGTDGGLGGTTRSFTYHFTDAVTESDLADVKLAIDTDRGRFEGVSDAAGMLTIEIAYDAARFDAVIAKEEYQIVAFDDYPLADPDPTMDVVESALNPLSPDEGALSPVRVSATGVPTGGRWCVGLGQWYSVCFAEGAEYSQMVSQAQIDEFLVERVTGWTFDDAGALVDFTEATWTMTGASRSATLAFDTTLDVTPVTRDMTLMLPTDAMSPFQTATLDPTWHGWMTVVEPGTHLQRNALTNVAIMADRITFTVNTFPVAGEELVWAAAVYADFAAPVRTFRWFSAEPTEDTIPVLDVPRVTAGDTYDAELEWTAPSADITSYRTQYIIGGFRTAITMVTDHPYGTLPALPAGYDRDVSFPLAGARGDVRVAAFRGDFAAAMTATDPFRFDGEQAIGPRRMINF